MLQKVVVVLWGWKWWSTFCLQVNMFLGNIGISQHGKYLFLLYQQTEHHSGDLLMFLHNERTFAEYHSKIPFMTLYPSASPPLQHCGSQILQKVGEKKQNKRHFSICFWNFGVAFRELKAQSQLWKYPSLKIQRLILKEVAENCFLQSDQILGIDPAKES